MGLFKSKNIWRIKATLTRTEKAVIGFVGFVAIILSWYFLTKYGDIPEQILPGPLSVWESYETLFNPLEKRAKPLNEHIALSLKRNFLGYLKAILWAIPLGFIIALVSPIRAIFEQYINTTRFIPIAALIGLFIIWYGIGEEMKVQFLAFGIFVYLLPAMINRIDEVQKTYENTARTLNASEWEIFKTIYLPKSLGLVSTDIINLTAISWTYIIVAENVNSNEGGVGVLCWQMARQSQYASAYGVLFTILIIGFLQDRILNTLDKFIFPWKYERIPGWIQFVKNLWNGKVQLKSK